MTALLPASKIEELERLHEAKKAADARNDAECTNRSIMLANDADEILIRALRKNAHELLRAARLALKAEAWLREHAGHTLAVLSVLSDAASYDASGSLEVLRKEFGLK